MRVARRRCQHRAGFSLFWFFGLDAADDSIEHSRLCLIDRRYGRVDRERCLPLQPLAMVVRAFDASIMLAAQSSQSRRPHWRRLSSSTHSNGCKMSSPADLMSRSTFWIAAVAAACACSTRTTTLYALPSGPQPQRLRHSERGRKVGELCGKRFYHDVPPIVSNDLALF